MGDSPSLAVCTLNAFQFTITLSRVLVQNNELKNQLAELQDGFVKMVTFVVTGKQSLETYAIYSTEPTKHGVGQ